MQACCQDVLDAFLCFAAVAASADKHGQRVGFFFRQVDLHVDVIVERRFLGSGWCWFLESLLRFSEGRSFALFQDFFGPRTHVGTYIGECLDDFGVRVLQVDHDGRQRSDVLGDRSDLRVVFGAEFGDHLRDDLDLRFDRGVAVRVFDSDLRDESRNRVELFFQAHADLR